MNMYFDILDQAHAAGEHACAGLPDTGACGFAWVVIPGTCGLARYCREKAADPGMHPGNRRWYGSKHWAKGWQFWNPGFYAGQSIDAAEKGAVAFAAVLKENGIDAQVGSRID